MSPQVEALAMLNNMFNSFDGRPVDKAILTRRDYAFLVQALIGLPEMGRELALANARIDYLMSPDSSSPEGREFEMPNAIWLAKFFHETYERLAPQFGYETRLDTRQFDHESRNGRLMIAVCEELRSTMNVAISKDKE